MAPVDRGSQEIKAADVAGAQEGGHGAAPHQTVAAYDRLARQVAPRNGYVAARPRSALNVSGFGEEARPRGVAIMAGSVAVGGKPALQSRGQGVDYACLIAKQRRKKTATAADRGRRA
jgi:hypothetical protein